MNFKLHILGAIVAEALMFIGIGVLVFFFCAWWFSARAEACPCGGRHVWSDRAYAYVYRCYRCEGPRVYGYEEREDRLECRDIRRAVGEQHLTEDGAKKAANDAWAGLIRFHLGEVWMDLKNARHIVYTCSRSSIKEAGTSVTTGFQQFNRCEISAQPCKAPPKIEVPE